MQKLIAMSKMKKSLQQETNDKLAEQTHNLDAEFKDISHLLTNANITTTERNEREIQADKSYGSFMEALEDCARAKPDDPIDEEKKTREGTQDGDDDPDHVILDVKKVPDVRDPKLKPIPTNHVSADDLGETFFDYKRHMDRKADIFYSQSGELKVPGGGFDNKFLLKKIKRKRRVSDDDLSDDDDSEDSAEGLESPEDEDSESETDQLQERSSAEEDEEENDDMCENSDDVIKNEGDVIENENEDLEIDQNQNGAESDTEEISPEISKIYPTNFDDFTTKIKDEYAEGGEKLKSYLENVVEILCKRTDYKRSCNKFLRFLIIAMENSIIETNSSSRFDANLLKVIRSSLRNVCVRNTEVSVSIVKELIIEKFQNLKSFSCLNTENYIFVKFLSQIYDLSCKGLLSLQLMICLFISKTLTKGKLYSISDLRNYLLFADLLLKVNSKPVRFAPEVIVVVENVLKLATNEAFDECSNVEIKAGFLRSGLTSEKKLKMFDDSQLLFLTCARMKQTPATRFQIVNFALELFSKCEWVFIQLCFHRRFELTSPMY